jgi:hypothetical protein
MMRFTASSADRSAHVFARSINRSSPHTIERDQCVALPQTGVTRISFKVLELEVRLIFCIEHKGPLNIMGSEPLRET